MCEKNLEGKVLSPSSSDESDTIPSDWEEVKSSKKKSSSKKRKRDKFCETCGQNITSNKKRNSYMFNNTYHQLSAKEYCKDHEFDYSDHKCRPCWCGDCGYLEKYEILISKTRD